MPTQLESPAQLSSELIGIPKPESPSVQIAGVQIHMNRQQLQSLFPDSLGFSTPDNDNLTEIERFYGDELQPPLSLWASVQG